MAYQICVFHNNKVHGPFSIEQVRQLIAKGRISKGTPIKVGEEDWIPAVQNGMLYNKRGNPIAPQNMPSTVPPVQQEPNPKKVVLPQTPPPIVVDDPLNKYRQKQEAEAKPKARGGWSPDYLVICISVSFGIFAGIMLGYYLGQYNPLFGGINAWGEPHSPARDFLARQHMVLFGFLFAVLGLVFGLLPPKGQIVMIAIPVVVVLFFVLVVIGGLLVSAASKQSHQTSDMRERIKQEHPMENPDRVIEAQHNFEEGIKQILNGGLVSDPDIIDRRNRHYQAEKPGSRLP